MRFHPRAAELDAVQQVAVTQVGEVGAGARGHRVVRHHVRLIGARRPGQPAVAQFGHHRRVALQIDRQHLAHLGERPLQGDARVEVAAESDQNALPLTVAQMRQSGEHRNAQVVGQVQRRHPAVQIGVPPRERRQP